MLCQDPRIKNPVEAWETAISKWMDAGSCRRAALNLCLGKELSSQPNLQDYTVQLFAFGHHLSCCSSISLLQPGFLKTRAQFKLIKKLRKQDCYPLKSQAQQQCTSNLRDNYRMYFLSSTDVRWGEKRDDCMVSRGIFF